jgi:hypothetical protein
LFEVYKNTVFYSNANGIGGTDAGGVRVGFDTLSPSTTFDMTQVKDGFLAIPNYTDAELSLITSVAPIGAMYFDTTNNFMAIHDNNGSSVGIQTVIDEFFVPGSYITEVGYVGGITNDASRTADISTVDNVVQPSGSGLGTSHMIYNTDYDKHQYATQQGTGPEIFRSYVSSATSALNIELDSTGTQVFITVAGVGSATLSLV